MLNTLGSRVIIDPVDKKVVAVEYVKDGVTKTVGVNKEVTTWSVKPLLTM